VDEVVEARALQDLARVDAAHAVLAVHEQRAVARQRRDARHHEVDRQQDRARDVPQPAVLLRRAHVEDVHRAGGDQSKGLGGIDVARHVAA